MKIAMIGAGNVATHLSKNLARAGEQVIQVFSRNLLKAKGLADAIGATWTNDLEEIVNTADLYIIAVSDGAIASIAKSLEAKSLADNLVVHTSGATPMAIFSETSPTLGRVGVFYPLQSLSKIRPANFEKIPICVDAKHVNDLGVLTDLARKLSPHIYQIDDKQRAILHLAAVFVNNFSNHLFSIGQKMVAAENIPFELLMPLMKETVSKLEDGTAAEMQTGPAIRHDVATIDRHIEQLKGNQLWLEIYQLMTKSIQAQP